MKGPIWPIYAEEVLKKTRCLEKECDMYCILQVAIFFVRMFWCLLKSLPRADFFESSLGRVGVFVAPAETTDKKWTLPVPWC